MYQLKSGRATSAHVLKTIGRRIESCNPSNQDHTKKQYLRPTTQFMNIQGEKLITSRSKRMSDITARENENLKRMSIINNKVTENNLKLDFDCSGKTGRKFNQRRLSEEELSNVFQRIKMAQNYTKNNIDLIEGIENEIYLTKEIKYYMKIESKCKIPPAILHFKGKFNKLTIYFSEYIKRPSHEYLELLYQYNRKLYVHPSEKRHRIFFQPFLFFAISSDIDVELTFTITFGTDYNSKKIDMGENILFENLEKPINSYKQINETIKNLMSNKELFEEYIQKVKEIKDKRNQKIFQKSKSINFITKNIIESRDSVKLISKRIVMANTRNSRMMTARRLSNHIERGKLRKHAIMANKWELKKRIVNLFRKS